MVAKKPIPLPTSRRKAVHGAVVLAMSVLQDERVREQLRKAPVAARDWAEQRRAIDASSRVSDPTAEPASQIGRARSSAAAAGGLNRFDPTARFGQRGLERRLAALERNAELVFPNPADQAGSAIFQAIDELGRAARISATMSMNERRKTRARISSELTRLERALVDAVLPPDAAHR